MEYSGTLCGTFSSPDRPSCRTGDDEIREIESGERTRDDSPLKNSPHTLEVVTASEWPHPYSRERAAYPGEWLRQRKFWPPVGRIDNAWGDRNLVCTCDPVGAYTDEAVKTAG